MNIKKYHNTRKPNSPYLLKCNTLSDWLIIMIEHKCTSELPINKEYLCSTVSCRVSDYDNWKFKLVWMGLKCGTARF